MTELKVKPLIEQAELEFFWYELKSKFRSGMRGIPSILYLFFTLLGVGLASWLIPSMNGSEISAETLGIYVIGFLVSVWLDALLILISQKGDGDKNHYEREIAAMFLVFSVVLTLWAWYLSLHAPAEIVSAVPAAIVPGSAHGTMTPIAEHKKWRWGAEYFLGFILLGSLAMSLILAGIDSEQPGFGSLERNVDAIKDK
jgi:hypothetical protein